MCNHRILLKKIKFYCHTKVLQPSFFFVTKEIGLEVNADKTKYMVMSREQTAGLSHTMKFDNSSIERVEEFKYLGTMLKKSKFYSGRN